MTFTFTFPNYLPVSLLPPTCVFICLFTHVLSMDPSTYLSFYTYVCVSTCVSMYLPTYLSVLSLSPGALSKNLQPKNSTPFSPRNRSRHPPRSCIGHFHHLESSPSIVPHPLPNCNTQMLVRFHEIQSIRGPGGPKNGERRRQFKWIQRNAAWRGKRGERRDAKEHAEKAKQFRNPRLRKKKLESSANRDLAFLF